jgi:hypothetical protein
MKIYASSGDEGGGGIEVPDPQSGGGGGGAAPDMSGYYAALQQQQDATRNAIAQAVMAQQAQQSQASPYGDYAQYFQPQSAPSGSPTDVGWMNALMPWQGGVSVGGQPGSPDRAQQGWIGGGSMARADPNYWMAGAGRRMTPKIAGYDDSWIGGGPGNSGAFGGMAPGSNGISDAEMGRAIADVNSNRGDPSSPTNAPSNPDGVFNNYGGITGPTSAGINGPSQSGGNAPATQGQPGSGTSFSGGWGGFGLGAQGISYGDVTGLDARGGDAESPF